MSEKHLTGVFDVEESFFQGICSCGWLSSVSFLEEVDLLRALHAHQVAVFGEISLQTDLSVVPVTVSEEVQEGRGV